MSYNEMGMVDPQGRFYLTDGLSHPDWCNGLVKRILRDIARDVPGRTLYVDDGDGSKYVPVDMRGRPSFVEIERVRGAHRY